MHLVVRNYPPSTRPNQLKQIQRLKMYYFD